MFQVLLQYFEDRFASFFVDEPLSNYQDLLDRVKKAVPMFKVVDDQQIIISCKHLPILTGTKVYMSLKPLGMLRLVDQTFTDESI